jgi:hypothetical protein
MPKQHSEDAYAVHCAHHRQAAAVVPQGRDVLRHRARGYGVEVPGLRPNAGDDAGPVGLAALGPNELGELGIRPEDAGDRLAHRCVGDASAENAGLDVGGELLPVELEEADGAQEAAGEGGADAEHVVALDQAAHHLRVHALRRVRAEDGLRWARALGTAGVPVLLALVVARQEGRRHQSTRRRRLRLHEDEVESLPLVNPWEIPVRNMKHGHGRHFNH